MRQAAALSLVAVLLVAVCNIPEFSECDHPEYTLGREYRDNLYGLEKDITLLYMEIQQEKNPQAVYENLLYTVERTAALIGEAEQASHDMHDALQISLQDHLEMFFLVGLSEKQRANLIDLGYTEEDISTLSEWLLYYNDYYYHSAKGFSPEKVDQLQNLGLTDEQILQLQTRIADHYENMHTAENVVKQQQRELMHIQVSLSLAAIKTLFEIEKGNSRGKNEVRLKNAEQELSEAILSASESFISWEKIRNLSKQVFKAAEQEICRQNTQCMVDFFVGVQMYCAAVTGLHGDTEFGLAEIELYKNVLPGCDFSQEMTAFSTTPPGEIGTSSLTPFSDDFEGRIEESNEINNLGVSYVFVKKPDMTLVELLNQLSDFIIVVVGEASWSWTFPDLSSVLDAVLSACVTVTSIVVGVVGSIFLLIITAPSVGYEWPPAIPGSIEGKEIIIIVEGSHGQGHIEERAESSNQCIKSSHEAILDDKYMIQDIVVYATKLLYSAYSGQYVYYYIDDTGDEWAVFIRKYGNTRYYELRTAYRLDCPGPYICIDEDGVRHEYHSIIKKWICEGFQILSMW